MVVFAGSVCFQMGTSTVCQRGRQYNYLPCASVCISTSELNGYWYVSLCIAYVSLVMLYSLELTLATDGLHISTVTKSFLWLFIYFPISCLSWLYPLIISRKFWNWGSLCSYGNHGTDRGGVFEWKWEDGWKVHELCREREQGTHFCVWYSPWYDSN